MTAAEIRQRFYALSDAEVVAEHEALQEATQPTLRDQFAMRAPQWVTQGRGRAGQGETMSHGDSLEECRDIGRALEAALTDNAGLRASIAKLDAEVERMRQVLRTELLTSRIERGSEDALAQPAPKTHDGPPIERRSWWVCNVCGFVIDVDADGNVTTNVEIEIRPSGSPNGAGKEEPR